MNRFYMLCLLLSGSVAAPSWGCPDLGVEVKTGNSALSKYPTRVTAKTIHIDIDKAAYSIYWKGSLAKGYWCYRADESDKETCLKKVSGNAQIALKDKKGAEKVLLRAYEYTDSALAGTEKKGALLALLAVTKKKNESVVEKPWLRFVYQTSVEGGDYETNELETLIQSARKKGLDDDAIKKMTLKHEIYADLFRNDETHKGMVDHWKILGSITVQKDEIPFASVPKGLAPKSQADLSTGNYRSKKGSGGCHTEVEEIE